MATVATGAATSRQPECPVENLVLRMHQGVMEVHVRGIEGAGVSNALAATDGSFTAWNRFDDASGRWTVWTRTIETRRSELQNARVAMPDEEKRWAEALKAAKEFGDFKAIFMELSLARRMLRTDIEYMRANIIPPAELDAMKTDHPTLHAELVRTQAYIQAKLPGVVDALGHLDTVAQKLDPLVERFAVDHMANYIWILENGCAVGALGKTAARLITYVPPTHAELTQRLDDIRTKRADEAKKKADAAAALAAAAAPAAAPAADGAAAAPTVAPADGKGDNAA